MAVKNTLKPVTKTIETGDINSLIVRVFGDAEHPTPKDEIQAKLDLLNINEQVSLFAVLGLYVQTINERLKAVERGILANSGTAVLGAFGDANANVEVTSSSGTPIGNVVFETSSEDVLNTTKSTKVADEVKKALTAAGLDSTYIKSTPRLDNTALKAALDAGKLPNSVSQLLKIKHDESRSVRFSPKGGK